jgi:hypothetical protein
MSDTARPILDPAVRAETLSIAERGLRDGNLDLADRACRELEQRGADSWRTWQIVAEVALRLGMRDVGLDAVSRALQDLSADRALLEPMRAGLERLPEPAAPAGGDRYHVIRAWGQGFWSDVDHVLGQLLVAELTGRTPIVSWGASSRFGGRELPRGRGGDPDPAHSAWNFFFRPVSACGVADLAGRKLAFFPSKFRERNLTAADSGQMEGPGSRLGALAFLGRAEPVTVSDFHTPMVALANWVPAWHRLHRVRLERMYEDLITRYLIPTDEIHAKADAAAAAIGLGDGPVIAVHVRGSDKTQELTDLHSVHALYQQQIVRLIKEHGPSTRVLLLTDWAPAEAEYRARLGARLLLTPSVKTGEPRGLHFQNLRPGRQLGEEVLIDALLATRCAAFVGLAYSNVSAFIAYWRSVLLGQQVGDVLIGPHLHRAYNLPLLRHLGTR